MPVEDEARRWSRTELRELVIARAGYCCDRCGTPLPGKQYSIQHRRARGAGGRRGNVLDTPANLILLCGSGTTGCHGLIECEERQRAGYDHGFAIRGEVQAPEEVPIFRHLTHWVIPSERDGVGLWLPADPIVPASA